MAGHSKWANTKHRKAAQDSKRAKVFTKIIRELTVAAKAGGNPDDNPKLRATIDKALGANMKRDTIEKAVARGAGGADGENYDEITYEGYGVGGVAVLVECLTDNRNRTVSEVRHAFSKRGGNLGTDGSVAYLFVRKGQISFAPGADEDAIMAVALEAGAEDVESNDDGSVDVTTAFEDYLSVKEAMVIAGLEPANAEVAMIAATQVPLDTQDDADKTLALIDMLEDLDDVQAVFTNADIPEQFFG
ncbi:YebC/PmpR family DNA-binding transcriptional regulator [Teredinibacter purpureus]|uniref:YebC/PmpR family DNA-binding transcriptional regulator n=1 Tax=Teredinibacter purpureus TaxID=2731756 RepID=UPI0005F7D18C|nr:YebC/PmpR family DNA-binding transcriptional regulator [Teredinibacter purpureus]